MSRQPLPVEPTDDMQADELFATLEGGQFLKDVTAKVAEVVAACHRAERHGIEKPKGKLKLAFQLQMDRSTLDVTVLTMTTELPKAKRPGTLLFTTAKGTLKKGAQGRQSEMFTPDEVRPALPIEPVAAAMPFEAVYGTTPAPNPALPVLTQPAPAPAPFPVAPPVAPAPEPTPAPAALPEPTPQPAPAEVLDDTPKMRVMP